MSEERNLSVSLRPRRFSEVIGYQRTIEQIKAQFASGRIPTALKFVGISRGGKTTLARILATTINCTHGEFGEPCDECLKPGTFEIHEVNAAAYGKVEDMRSLLTDLNVMPMFGTYRVYIIDECQQMSAAAQNVLLKPLEDKDSINIFIFCTTDDSKVIPALKKRCGPCQFYLEGLTDREVEELVVLAADAVGAGWEDATAQNLAHLLVTRNILAPGDIVSAVERVVNGSSIEEAAVSSDFSGQVDVWALCNAAVRGDWAGCRVQLALAQPRDGDELRLRLAAFFRSLMLKDDCTPTRAALLSVFIQKMISIETNVAGMSLNGVISATWNICQEVNKARQATMPRAA